MLFRHLLQTFSLDVVGKLLLALAAVLLIRWMSPRDFAQYAYVLSVAGIGSQIVGSVFNRVYLFGSAPGDVLRPERVVSAQVQACAMLLLVLTPLVGWQNPVNHWVGPLMLALCLSEFARTHFQRELRFGTYALMELVRCGFFLGGVVLVASFRSWSLSTGAVLGLQTVALAAVAVVALVGLCSLGELLRPVAWRRWASILGKSDSGYLSGYFVLLAVQGQLSILLLKAVADDRQLATFASAWRYYGLLQLALVAVHTVVPAHLQKQTSLAELRQTLNRLRPLILPFAAGVLAIAILSRWFIPWIDGGKYPQAVNCFAVLCVSVVVGFATSPHVNLLLRMRDFRVLFYSVLSSLLASTWLTWHCATNWGAVGAALAAAVSATAFNIAMYGRARLLFRAAFARQVHFDTIRMAA